MRPQARGLARAGFWPSLAGEGGGDRHGLYCDGTVFIACPSKCIQPTVITKSVMAGSVITLVDPCRLSAQSADNAYYKYMHVTYCTKTAKRLHPEAETKYNIDFLYFST